MQFDSLAFLIFFPTVFTLYYALARWRGAQNVLLLASSLLFYGWWDWRFLGLMVLSSGIDWAAALIIDRSSHERQRRLVLTASLTSNIVILGYFKYANFFADSLAAALPFLTSPSWRMTLDVVLPVGISFYTFQSMGYTIDVYRRELPAERNPLVYFAFVAFFPHLVAGPIQRASNLLPQFRVARHLTLADVREALWLIAYGFFLKTVGANGAATFADTAFRAGQESGWTVILGTVAFGVQIYLDFNAYSLIARGTALLLGFRLIWNFRLPYASSSLRDFWRRWHISLSTWLRDYLYVGLGGSRRGRLRTYVNLFVTMTLGGLWHGAAWNFVAWGALHGVGLAVERAIIGDDHAKRSASLPGWAVTMAVVFIGWFLFRVPSWPVGRDMMGALGDLTWRPSHTATAAGLAVLAAPVVAIEAWQLRRDDLLAATTLPEWSFAALVGVLCLLTIAMFGQFQYAFIYFQF